LDAAFVFGTLGNLSGTLGSGWSVEDHFAWAVGAESRITLPLPGDDTAYELHFEVHPLTLPGVVSQQRLIVLSADTNLASFEMTKRQTVVIPLPVELTQRRARLDLTLVHPDAARPSDHRQFNDSRLLALCFHSASLRPARSGGTDNLEPRQVTQLEAIHGVIAGDSAARRIGEVISKLPSLRGRFGIHYIDLSDTPVNATRHLPPNALQTTRFCWMNTSVGTPDTRNSLLRSLPADCTPWTFYTPAVGALWPFLTRDPRAVPEPGRYHPARYPFGDRLAQALLSMNMPDDVVALMYESSVEQEQLDLDAMLAADMARWRVNDNRCSIKLADFIAQHFRSSRIFHAPTVPGPALLREMIRQALAVPIIQDLVAPDILSAELDDLLDGFVSWREELPVHQRVARHFALPWWSPELKYRWQNNRYTGQEYIIDYIRWTQWRP
jgi:hypothetical protein